MSQEVRFPTYIVKKAGTIVVAIPCHPFPKDGGMGHAIAERPVVLIVEDDFLLRIDAVDIVLAAGFDVVEASNADEAIAILEARPNIHVVFTDIQMPGSMDGLKLAKFVKNRWPNQDHRDLWLRQDSGDDLPEGGRFL